MKRSLNRLRLIKYLDKLLLFDSEIVVNNNSIIKKFKRKISIAEENLSSITILSGRSSPVDNYHHRVRSNSIGEDEELQFIMEIPGKRIEIETFALKVTFIHNTDDKANICFLNAYNKENDELIQNEKPMTFQEISLFLEKITLVN